MVKSVIARVLALAVLLAGVAVAAAPGAYAGGIDGPSSSSSDGDPQYGTTGNCSTFATSSSYGLNCGAGGGDAQTVLELLGNHNDPPTCWDTAISDTDITEVYGGLPPIDDDSQYFQITCITGLDVTKPIFEQPHLQIKQPPPTPIKKNAPACTPPFTYNEENGFANDCKMTLIDYQKPVAGYFARKGSQIPGISFSAFPSPRIRTQVPTAYEDVYDCQDCVTPKRTETINAGGHTMYAQRTDFRIMPYGKGTTPSIQCDGTADVPDDATPQSFPKGCWYTYTHSSGTQPGRYYPMTAAATWQVVLDGGVYATFVKYSQINLSVVDVQSLVISQTN